MKLLEAYIRSSTRRKVFARFKVMLSKFDHIFNIFHVNPHYCFSGGQPWKLNKSLTAPTFIFIYLFK